MKENTKIDELAGDSKAITTNQSGIHEKLDEVVQRHLTHPFQKPYQVHTQKAFDDINERVKAYIEGNPDGKVILDSCCGVGQSTRLLASLNPDALVIGVDKSSSRIERNVKGFDAINGYQAENFQLVRADLNDFYRLVKVANWPISKHYILYPNPWPKSKHLQRRWHGSAVFPTLISLGKEIILRSNWRLYLEEFQQAANHVDLIGDISALEIDEQPLTPFEAKYQASGQICWQLSFTR
ncbi:SAM-dependent methyltransferase [Colwellia sp. 1_MG-2023]|uniref:tRNA (guanine(46)-N(7))-methyltransferase TrmB n=1 Tax=unclassified Colwellia TaxID=196834 RepID=UPI001C098657|nr:MULTISPECIES: SAM-dependent methyltransferase [unclassified Colwellia]MBU2925068.1 SAM-dependent methyltransferase [Colwellia sp. C2M11]MDO6486473.1 SAM-dependent methyltransferase [Colwellia sp. 6_MG-2023]MDO6651639.1 SAM-dependent methyltransferase [Colwellia sp. 3_MG-2023]MDO6664963.1 SAM-dependent methyltransferase [Colwellia sp. 2_MG-2023]MDO6689336.1 SAM-dependent methyltransferase [Colwellia sp. 1_MG-2023]